MSLPPPNIEDAILSAILAGRIEPGTRLGEQQLADLFGVSRTRVREAMMRLKTRGIVEVSARRGWFVIEPSAEDARDAFQTRRVIETGLLQTLKRVPPEVIAGLKRHIAMEEEAISAGDVTSRACLLGDFHIHLAEALGNRLLTEIIRDLTARTTLISMLYQPTERAEESSHDHADIVAALEAGDIRAAAWLMDEHITKVEAGLDFTAKPDPLAGLRDLLTPAPATAAAERLPPHCGPEPTQAHAHAHAHAHLPATQSSKKD